MPRRQRDRRGSPHKPIKKHGAATDPLAVTLARRLERGSRINVLGVDPGTNVVGYGSITVDVKLGRNDRDLVSICDVGVLRAPRLLTTVRRINHLHKLLRDLIEDTKPDLVVFERTYNWRVRTKQELVGAIQQDELNRKGMNPATTLVQAEGRGALIAALAYHDDVAFAQLAPSSVRAVVVGRGNASKEETRRGICLEYPAAHRLDQDHKIPDDAFDGLALALAWRVALDYQ